MKPASTKERIEEKAIAIFSEKGYDAASMRELAEASGVTKPVIYYYFNSKENLCNHLVRSGLEDFREQLRLACDSSSDDAFEQIVAIIQTQFDFCKRNVDFVRFIYALNFGPDRKKIAFDFTAYGMEILRMMTKAMRRASKTGIIRKGKEEVAVYYLRGIISTYVMLYVDGRSELRQSLARTIATDLVDGLGAAGRKKTEKNRTVPPTCQ